MLGLVQNRDNSSFFSRQRQAFVHALSCNCTNMLHAVEEQRQQLGILNKWQDLKEQRQELGIFNKWKDQDPSRSFLSSPTTTPTMATTGRDWIAAPRGSLNKLAAEEDSSIPHKLDTIIFEKMDMILAKMEKVDTLFEAVSCMRTETAELRHALQHYTPRPGEQAGMPADPLTSKAPQSLRRASLLEGTGA